MAWVYWPDIDSPVDDGHMTYRMMLELRDAMEERCKIPYPLATITIPGDVEPPRGTSSLKQRYWYFYNGSTTQYLQPIDIISIIAANFCMDPTTMNNGEYPERYTDFRFRCDVLGLPRTTWGGDVEDAWREFRQNWLAAIPTKLAFNRLKRAVQLCEYFFTIPGISGTETEYTYEVSSPPEYVSATASLPASGLNFGGCESIGRSGDLHRRTEAVINMPSGFPGGTGTVFLVVQVWTLTNSVVYSGSNNAVINLDGVTYTIPFPAVPSAPWEAYSAPYLISKTGSIGIINIAAQTSIYGGAVVPDVDLNCSFATGGNPIYRPGFTYP